MEMTCNELKEKIKELHSEGRTNIEIMQEMKIDLRTLFSFLQRLKLKSNKHIQFKEDSDFKQFIYGSMLGDGTLTPIRGYSKTSRIRFSHGASQYFYAEHKHNFIKKYGIGSKKVRVSVYKDNRFENRYYTHNTVESVVHPIFTKYREDFYPQNVKIIPQYVYENLDWRGVAWWFMDDGSVTGSSIELNTMNFTLQEIEKLRDMFIDKFNLHFNIITDKRVLNKNRGRKMYLQAKDFNKFVENVKPLILPEFYYKFVTYEERKRVQLKSDKLLENPEEDNQQPIISLND